MATIAENLQILKGSTDAIKLAIIDKGGTVSGDISTWAEAISGISGELLTFTLDDIVYFFQDGMTWDEYLSITNPKNICYMYDCLYKLSDNYVHIYTQSIVVLNGPPVYLTDTILPQVYRTELINNSGSD